MQTTIKKAFTLAEVMIVIGIIGIVAELTIPQLVSNFEEKVTVTRVKKYYSVISSAIKEWEAENSCLGDISQCISAYTTFDCKNAFGDIESKLRIVDRRYQNNTNFSNIDWLPDKTIGLNGVSSDLSWMSVSKNSYQANITCNYLMQDGITMTVVLPDDYQVGGFIWFDVNGKKKPNRIGKDTFVIGLGSDNSKYEDINPYFNENGNTTTAGVCSITGGNNCNADDGHSPTAYVLVHDKLPDLKVMGY